MTRSPSPAGVFERMAARSVRRPRRALVAWLLALGAVSAASGVAGSDYRNDFSLPGTESEQARETLESGGVAQAGDSLQLVLRAPGGIRSAPVRERVERLAATVRELPGVAAVQAPYGEQQAIAEDGTIGYATVALDGTAQDVAREDVERILDAAVAADGEELRVEVGGDAARGAEEGGGGAGEGAGLLAALVILVLLFGSVVAASLPIITAVFAVGTALGLIALASRIATVADFTAPIMLLVGLGVGIDYALLIFARFRSELLAGADRAAAVPRAIDRAGRTVFFAGCTVIIALLGLVALGLGSLQGVALAVALTVLATMAASLTLLPALIALFGARIERGVRRREARSCAPDGHVWRRWADGVLRRPLPVLAAAIAMLGALCAPALDLRLGFADAGTDPPSSTTRQAYDLLADGFGPGFNGPLIVVAAGDAAAGPALREALLRADGIEAAGPPIPSRDGRSAAVIAVPASAPQDPETHELVQRLRSDVVPAVERSTGARVLVGGATAAAVDFADRVGSRLPLFVGVVVGLSILLLTIVFRSLLIPLKAAVLNLLSIGAALGVITIVFGDGALGAQPGPVEAFVPIMVFAIVFGLSMDYEVFLIARMHEHYAQSGDARGAVREGLATTGRVITAAAAIMVVVFGAFLLSPSRMLQQFGLGLATAILVDAAVIRCLVVPAVMALLGDRAWWMPRALGRRLPRVALERV